MGQVLHGCAATIIAANARCELAPSRREAASGWPQVSESNGPRLACALRRDSAHAPVEALMRSRKFEYSAVVSINCRGL